MVEGTKVTVDLATVGDADVVGEALASRLPRAVTQGLRPGGGLAVPTATVRERRTWTRREAEAMSRLPDECGLTAFLEDVGPPPAFRAMTRGDPDMMGITTEGVAYMRYCDGDTTLALRVLGTGVAVVSHDARKDHEWSFLEPAGGWPPDGHGTKEAEASLGTAKADADEATFAVEWVPCGGLDEGDGFRLLIGSRQLFAGDVWTRERLGWRWAHSSSDATFATAAEAKASLLATLGAR